MPINMSDSKVLTARVFGTKIFCDIEGESFLDNRCSESPSSLPSSVLAIAVHIPGLTHDQMEQRIRDALELARIKAMDDGAPCSLCGYNGPGWYNHNTHPCAGGPND